MYVIIVYVSLYISYMYACWLNRVDRIRMYMCFLVVLRRLTLAWTVAIGTSVVRPTFAIGLIADPLSY